MRKLKYHQGTENFNQSIIPYQHINLKTPRQRDERQRILMNKTSQNIRLIPINET